MDGIPIGVLVGQGGPWVLAGIICFFIVRSFVNGVIYARSVVEDLRRERDEWRTVARESVDQNSQLLEYARTADAILRSLQDRVRQP